MREGLLGFGEDCSPRSGMVIVSPAVGLAALDCVARFPCLVEPAAVEDRRQQHVMRGGAGLGQAVGEDSVEDAAGFIEIVSLRNRLHGVFDRQHVGMHPRLAEVGRLQAGRQHQRQANAEIGSSLS